MIRTISFLAFVFALSISVFPQTLDEPGCATKEGRQLDFLVGNWTVSSKYRIGNGKWEETEGTSRIKPLFEQCLLTEKLSVSRNGKPLTIFAFYGYSNISQNYQWMFAHSEHGVMSLYEGPLKDEKFSLDYSLQVRGRTIMFKRVLKQTDNGFELTANRSFDAGKNWRVDWVLNYVRTAD